MNTLPSQPSWELIPTTVLEFKCWICRVSRDPPSAASFGATLTQIDQESSRGRRTGRVEATGHRSRQDL